MAPACGAERAACSEASEPEPPWRPLPRRGRPPGSALRGVPVPEGAKSLRSRVASPRHMGSISRRHGSGTGGRILKDDVLQQLPAAQDGGGGDGAAAPPGAAPARAHAARGRRDARPLHDESLGIPTATSIRTISVTTLDARRRQLNSGSEGGGARHKGVVHAPDRLRDHRGRAKKHPAMGHTFRRSKGNLTASSRSTSTSGLAVDVQRRRRLSHAHRPGDQRRRRAGLRRLPRSLRGADREDPQRRRGPDELQGATITLTNPGGLGTVASIPRLMPGQGSSSRPARSPTRRADQVDRALAEMGNKVMTMTSTYDHRVIQGAESGAFLRPVEELLQGSEGFFERLLEPRASAAAGAARGSRGPDAGHSKGAAAAAPPPSSPRARRCCSTFRPRPRCQGPPHAWPPRGPPRPARLRAHRRPGAGARDGRADRGDHGARSRRASSASRSRARTLPRRCLTCGRPTAGRSRTRSSTSPNTGSASGCGSASSRESTAAPASR